MFAALLLTFATQAQIIKDPSTWSYEVKKKGDNKYDLIFKVKLQEHWHVWSLTPGGDGMLISPSFKFGPNKSLKLIGKVSESGNKISKDFDGEPGLEHYFEHNVTYTQSIEVKENTKITGTHRYQTCDETQCLNAVTKPFSFNITDAVALNDSASSDSDTASSALAAAGMSHEDSVALAANAASVKPEAKTDKQETAKGNGDNKEVPRSLWMIFLTGLGQGLVAVLTPCIYSMLPITVSFFTKKAASRKTGIKYALFYSFSIVFIFALLGMVITLAFGNNALNNLATNWIANIFFAVLFIIFAMSFLGAFEITLPSSFTSSLGTKSNASSYRGIFFMALTLVIVSFSCTSAFIGNITALASRGGRVGPLVGFASFGLGIALPFAVFALFPSYLKNLEKPGGWQNSIKVTLGFLELALALKFLSMADLAKGWRLLDREIFIACWVVIFILLGFYLLGKLRFKHDSDLPVNHFGVKYIGVPRLVLALSSFVFAMYLIPGMWGAPLKAVSSFVPPMRTQDFVSGGAGTATEGMHNGLNGIKPVKYVDKLSVYEPAGFTTFFDLDEAKAAAKKLNKPLMLDFTGITCINCRKMEGQVWSDPQVMKMLKEDFVIVSLYCDFDAEELPAGEQYDSKILGAKVVTVGDKNEDYQATRFNSNSQPYYFFIDENDVQLHPKGYQYDPSVDKFIQHLNEVKAKYKSLHP